MDFNGQFWGAKLDGGGGKKKVDLPEGTFLLITGACVDVSAPADKRAVLTLEIDDEEYTVASLTPGAVENVALDIPLYGSVCLRNRGSKHTAIHILGRFVTTDPEEEVQMNGNSNVFNMDSDDEDDEDYEDDIDIEKDIDDEIDDDDEDEDDESDDEVEETIKPKKKKSTKEEKKKVVSKRKDAEDDEDDEDDEDYVDTKESNSEEISEMSESSEGEAVEKTETAKGASDGDDDDNDDDDDDDDDDVSEDEKDLENLVAKNFPSRTGEIETDASSSKKRKMDTAQEKSEKKTKTKETSLSPATRKGIVSREEFLEFVKDAVAKNSNKLQVTDLGNMIHSRYAVGFKKLGVAEAMGLKKFLNTVEGFNVSNGFLAVE
eukprot:CAMPEP_0184020720 /NCGR_PEP_ID=MMETSP0954-20121128/9513_1 /TAXON_ID=627963 /ORGANISM="Aplanochytrium sp, Strain PBS07" /LENGTH=375 /DNA_ID=CAMNT_0026302627 /DNA_START=118 /DNA_END=1245 /DNA_ORIENTATION=-